MTSAGRDSEVVWRPSADIVERANLTKLQARFQAGSYAALIAQIAQGIEPFYSGLLTELALRWDHPWTTLLDCSRGKPFAKWFAGALFNAPANCLDRHIDAGRGSSEALVWEGEDGSTERYTFTQLRDEVARFAAVLIARGVGHGDTVGIFMPLLPQTAIALLAIGYIGAIAVPAFSGYGPAALAARLADAKARVLLTADGVTRRGKPVPLKTIADEAAALSRSVGTTIMFRRLGIDVPFDSARDLDWAAAVSAARPVDAYVRTSANDPYLLLYTSGSTGKPKGAVHVHAGFPLKVLIDQYMCMDVNPGDRMLWYTDMGWMMGPFLVLGTLGLGATVVLYEGTPDFPAPDRMWRICEQHRVTHLGIAPTAIRSLMAHGDEYPRRHDLRSLRILASSGEAWNTEPYLWYLRNVGGGRCPIINYSGGTEIGGGILSSFATMPLVPNCFHGPVPGMVADVLDPDGAPVRGAVGELAVREPWPGMTQSFWGPDDERYLQTYWRRFDGVWVHGDWAQVQVGPEGEFWFIRGRSDDTINVAGKRVGPAEFESALVADPAVREAATIAVPDSIKGDTPVCLVVVGGPQFETEEVRARLFGLLDRELGKSLRPKAIRFVDELPKTRNMKVMRRVARGRYLGIADLGDLSALENPSALEAIDRHR